MRASADGVERQCLDARGLEGRHPKEFQCWTFAFLNPARMGSSLSPNRPFLDGFDRLGSRSEVDQLLTAMLANSIKQAVAFSHFRRQATLADSGIPLRMVSGLN
jgi:hypothetical protein